MSSRFVEFNSYGGGSTFVNAEEVKAVVPSYAESHGCTEIHLDEDAVLVTESPAEVVAKLQGEPLSGVLNNVAAPPAESEAVQLLERWKIWWENSDAEIGSTASETLALLAKLKGGK